ncbi:hypothetical protein B0H17DRAFT_1096798 [Mycena rosella]|uniref:BTB domain-containing protein n=1 Tax=Mycena rosella TaxID=1033263 RepID=A0AAD7CQQ3_MYCRO|nr:hypothetical protein B0H17DRAFT_1096798 [Mycena rosella]
MEENAQTGCSLDQCRRVPDLWFPDANLVLRAENTLFRVYIALLCARSSVFSDMISVPQPAEPGQTLDGHPVVYLYDSAAEVEVFLRAIFDSNYLMPPPSPTEFAIVMGVMRLAHKYDVPYLFRRALVHLESSYPATLSEFIAGITKTAATHVNCDEDVAVNLITIRALLEVGAVWLLPAAYYSACTFLPDELVSARKSWDALGAEQQQRCLTAQADLVRATTRTYRWLRRIPSLDCDSPDGCQRAVSVAYQALERRADKKLDTNPLAGWAVNKLSAKLCEDGCRPLWNALCTEALESLWRELPGLLGLPEWEELYKRRAEVLEATT